MTQALQFLVAEAQSLAGDHPCTTTGHSWESEGGRVCPGADTGRDCGGSQPVYRCARCGGYDYGESGGPGWLDCQHLCHKPWRQP